MDKHGDARLHALRVLLSPSPLHTMAIDRFRTRHWIDRPGRMRLFRKTDSAGNIHRHRNCYLGLNTARNNRNGADRRLID
jgi:hypothetical protein